MSFRKEILKIHIPTPTDCPAQSVFFLRENAESAKKSLKKPPKIKLLLSNQKNYH